MNKSMDILVTLDSNYIPPLKVMLRSLFLTNPGISFNIHMIYSIMKPEEVKDLEAYTKALGGRLIPIFVNDELFSEAPTVMHYTKAMYYRLLAHELLDESLDKILYLDPDILVINPIGELYNTDISDYLFAAASHTSVIPVMDNINKVRLKTYEAKGYFNSGVLLINLKLCRKTIKEKDIFTFIEENKNELILPDQDVLNALYGKMIKPVDDSLYNMDARYTETYRLISMGKIDTAWVMENTVILHFCGKKKPWLKGSINKYAMLYRHYMRLTEIFKY